jgi:serine/threonine-protein kinase PknG
MTAIAAKCASCSGAIVDGACEDCGRVPAGLNLIGPDAPAATTATRSSLRRASTRATSNSTIRVTVAVGQSAARRVPATRSSTTRRRALGGGLVSLPFQPTTEPLDLLMKDPTIPASKRVCQKCGAATAYDKGFCTNCGVEYNFIPSLKAGDIVAGQYRIKGPIAYGGLGWIFLGFDELLNRWVVLKGLLNSKDEEAAAAAMAERQFLAAVKHPKIVQIFNFTHQGPEGFIVMEYVGGKTINAIRRERGPLPVAEAIAYVLGILPAFSYLHSQNLVYCDFKPNNLMLEADDVKLIDMGAVRRIGDPDGAVFGTVGYMAPEADQDPSAVSDLYTIGRTLAELVMNFKMASHDDELPWPENDPVLLDNESLKLFLDRACAKDPALRFQDADEMFEQLYGVLREVVCLDTDEPKPAVSERFLGDGLVEPSEQAIWRPIAASLPRLRPNPEDSAAGAIMASAGLKPNKLAPYLAALRQQFPRSKELNYAEIDLLISEGDYPVARSRMETLHQANPYDWKIWFLQGRLAFLEGDYKLAAEQFARLRAELPGEPAAQMALALALESFGEPATAEPIYDRVSKADPSYASAAFGLARCRLAAQTITADDHKNAVQALNRIPATSALYAAAQMAAVRILISDLPNKISPPPTSDDLKQASEIYAALGVDNQAAHLLAADILLKAAQEFGEPQSQTKGLTLLGCAANPRDLKLGAEKSLRRAARFTTDPASLTALIDRANQVRPRTLF